MHSRAHNPAPVSIMANQVDGETKPVAHSFLTIMKIGKPSLFAGFGVRSDFDRQGP